MHSFKDKKVLISGASIAGLTTAWWMAHLGYSVTVVEIAAAFRTAGAAINVDGPAVAVFKRMGMLDELKAARINVEAVQVMNADNTVANSVSLPTQPEDLPEDNIEIERDKFVGILSAHLQDNAKYLFNNRITALNETADGMAVTFKDGTKDIYHLVLGCDGAHSGVRQLWFGHEQEYSHFLNAYFSITIVNKLLVPQKTMQMFNSPDRAIMLNAYNGKTDIIFCFYAGNEIPYDYRDIETQRQLVIDQFTGQSWRAPELLAEIKNAPNFYFDKFCQIKMPMWTKGRVALVGDAGYCASPAAGVGGSLSIAGAAALADALMQHNGNYELAFAEYNKTLRPYIDNIQADAEGNVANHFIIRTEEAIQKRNAAPLPFS